MGPSITGLCFRAYKTANDKGFHEYLPVFGKEGRDTRHILSWLMLITTEIGEAAEAARKGDRINFDEELADVAIRLFDMCYALGVDLESEVLAKMVVNEARPHRHGGKLA